MFRALGTFGLGALLLIVSPPLRECALDQLAAEHPRVATIIRLRFLEDRSIEDTAAELGMSAGTVKRDFAFGRVWLLRALTPGQ